MSRAAVLVLLVLALAGCQRAATPAGANAAAGSDAGAALERAAIASGLVTDPDRVVPTGTFGSDTDLICLLPLRDGDYRIGASVDLGEQQSCVGRGIARGRTVLDVDLGGNCRFAARLDGDRLTFPAVLPADCRRSCVGRASLDALGGERLGETAAEAASVRGADGRLLCPG